MSATAGVRIGVIGYGHWGPNHVRVFNQLPGSRVVHVADPDGNRRDALRAQFRDVRTSDSPEHIFADPDVDAVVVATPLRTHFELTRAALLAGKDVLVEKPITPTAAEADELADLAEAEGRVLMCGHVFLFNPGIQKLRQCVEDGTVGRVYYVAATRTNLGPIRMDANALYDLGSHDVSIFHHLLGSRPEAAAAWGACYLRPDVEDVAFACLHYPGGALCHAHVSWLNPLKERTVVLVGDKRMAVFDDTGVAGAVRLYDKGLLHEPYYDSFGQFQLILRDADVLIPKLPAVEPLRQQNQHFLDCVRQRATPVSDGRFARDVVATLEALQRSLDASGERQLLGAPIRLRPR